MNTKTKLDEAEKERIEQNKHKGLGMVRKTISKTTGRTSVQHS